MSAKFTHFLAFFAGAAISGGITWLITRDYYQKIAKDEVDQVRQHYSGKIHELSATAQQAKMDQIKQEAEAAATKYDTAATTDESAWIKKESERQAVSYDQDYRPPKTHTEFKDPYVITPEEFSDSFTFEKKTYLLFKDDVFFDESTELPVPEALNIIGEENLEQMGAIEPNTLYVRNEKYGTDYEIISESEMTFEEYSGEGG